MPSYATTGCAIGTEIHHISPLTAYSWVRGENPIAGTQCPDTALDQSLPLHAGREPTRRCHSSPSAVHFLSGAIRRHPNFASDCRTTIYEMGDAGGLASAPLQLPDTKVTSYGTGS